MPATSVYLVDDDASVRRSLSRLLRIAGYDVETFDSAEAFLASGRPLPACFVLDIHLPGIDGLELQRRLAASAAQVPVVAISGHGEENTRQRALDAGASAYLDKPFSEAALLDAIGQALASGS